MRGLYFTILLLIFTFVVVKSLNCQPCKLLEARKTHANETITKKNN
ncbi:uncharacterized protein [Drosophila tropicalis]